VYEASPLYDGLESAHAFADPAKFAQQPSDVESMSSQLTA
jgi:hypothetical protein